MLPAIRGAARLLHCTAGNGSDIVSTVGTRRWRQEPLRLESVLHLRLTRSLFGQKKRQVTTA